MISVDRISPDATRYVWAAPHAWCITYVRVQPLISDISRDSPADLWYITWFTRWSVIYHVVHPLICDISRGLPADGLHLFACRSNMCYVCISSYITTRKRDWRHWLYPNSPWQHISLLTRDIRRYAVDERHCSHGDGYRHLYLFTITQRLHSNLYTTHQWTNNYST